MKRISVPTLHRWRIEAELGIGGLVPKHGRMERECLALTHEQQEEVVRLIHENPAIRPVRVYEYIDFKYTKIPGASIPDKSTIYRFMERWKERNEQLCEYLLDPASWKYKYQLALGDKASHIVRFCQRWEIDSTPGDIECGDGWRYTGIGLIDIFSRLCVVLMTETSKSTGIAAVMRRGMLDLGIPEEIGKDHGQDYDSKHTTAVCDAFNIRTPYIPPGTPEGKPFIERFFRTLSTGLFEELPGYCGHNVADRQAIRNREKAREEFVRKLMRPGGLVKVGLSVDEIVKARKDQKKAIQAAARAYKGLKDAVASNPMMERLGELERNGEKIRPIIRTEESDLPIVAEAKRAVADQLRVMEIPDAEELERGVQELLDYKEPELEEEKALRELAEKRQAEGVREAKPAKPAPGAGGNVYEGRRPLFRFPQDRYRWCLERLAEGCELREEEVAFMRRFEQGMDEATRSYWETIKDAIEIGSESGTL